MYPTADEVRAAVQAAYPHVEVRAIELANGAGGPVYGVSFAEHAAIAPEPTT